MKKLILLLCPLLFCGCFTVTIQQSESTETEKVEEVEEVKEITNSLSERHFEIKHETEVDDGILPESIVSWIEAELEDQEEYEIITFNSNKEAQDGFEQMKAHEQQDLDDIISEQDGIFIQTDKEDNSVKAMFVHDNLVIIGEREDGNLDLLIQQFKDWNLM